MNDFLTEPPMTPDVMNAIRRNERASKEAMTLIAKRHRNLGPEKCFESIANTIGILAAELVRDGNSLMGEGFAEAMRDLVVLHVDRSLTQIKETRT